MNLSLTHAYSIPITILFYQVLHLTEYGELLEKHFHRTVLDYIPKEAWRKLDNPEMIDKPDFNRFVFCKVLKNDVEIDDQNHSQGSYLIARYETIQSHVIENQIELLL
jgi:DNA replication complex GINS protein SLD5 C-terminus